MWRSCRLRSWYWCGGMRNLHSFGVCCCWRIRLEVEFDKYSIGEADSIHKLVWGTESCGRASVDYRQASVNGMRYCDCEMRRVEWEDTTRPHYKAWWRVTRLSWRLVLRCFTIMTPVLLRTSEGLRAEASVRHSRVAICCSSDSQSSTSEASVKPKPHVSLRSPSKPAPSPKPSVCIQSLRSSPKPPSVDVVCQRVSLSFTFDREFRHHHQCLHHRIWLWLIRVQKPDWYLVL